MTVQAYPSWNRGLFVLLGIVALLFLLPFAAAQSSVTYTTTADFNKGAYFNTNATDVADQVGLSKQKTTYPVMWIANAGEDSVSKIDTNTGNILAKYKTFWDGHESHYAWGGAAPSRTAVDKDGNVYVANRHFDGRSPAVIKILANGGIDRNGDGAIETSTGATDVKACTDRGTAGVLDIADFDDERIAWVTVLPDIEAGALGRSLTLDANGDVWVGTYNTRNYYKLSGADGTILGGPYPTGATNYGSAIDINGILWGASLGGALVMLDTNNPTNHQVFNGYSNYGITLANGKVYLGGSSSPVVFDPVSQTFSWLNNGYYPSNGVAVDSNGNIFTKSSSNNGIAKFAADGTLQWNTPGDATYGIVVDSNNDVWGINLSQNSVTKYSGVDGHKIGNYPTGESPYTYSDATGLTAEMNTQNTGTWAVIQDGGVAGMQWGKITWNSEAAGKVPDGTSLVVEVRAADNQSDLQNLNYTAVSNGVTFTAPGRYIQTRATLTANHNGDSPILSDITIASALPPDFAIAEDRNALTVRYGESTTLILTLSPINGFNSPVALSCSGMPAGMNWWFTPASVTPQGTSKLVLAMPKHLAQRRNSTLPWTAGSLFFACFFSGAVGLRRRKGLAALLLLLALAGSMAMVGCNGGFAPTSTSTVTVTGTSGSLQHSVSFQVTVQ